MVNEYLVVTALGTTTSAEIREKASKKNKYYAFLDDKTKGVFSSAVVGAIETTKSSSREQA